MQIIEEYEISQSEGTMTDETYQDTTKKIVDIAELLLCDQASAFSSLVQVDSIRLQKHYKF